MIVYVKKNHRTPLPLSLIGLMKQVIYFPNVYIILLSKFIGMKTTPKELKYYHYKKNKKFTLLNKSSRFSLLFKMTFLEKCRNSQKGVRFLSFGMNESH